MFPKEVLNIRAFRHLWLGQAISQFGDAFYYVVFMFMVQKLTGSVAMVGFTGAFETLPYLLFSAYAGVLADRMDRKRIMMLSDVLSGSVLVLFALCVFLFVKVPVWTIFASAFLTSTVRAFFMPAKSAAVPNLVPKNLLLKANAFSSMTQTVMPMLGLALSASVLGMLYAISRTWFFETAILVNAASFFLSAAYIRLLPTIVPDKFEERHPWVDFKDGLSYIKHRKVLLVQLLLAIGLNLMISPFFVFYVEANRLWFGGKPQTLSICEFTFFVGLIVGSAVVGKMKFKRPGLGFIVAMLGIGVGVVLMGFSQQFWLFCAWNVLCGLTIPFADIPFMTYTQIVVEDTFRGRVNSANNMLRAGIMPLGMSLGGMLVKLTGLVGGFLLMGLGLVAVALLGLLSREFRESEIPETSAHVDVSEFALETSGAA